MMQRKKALFDWGYAVEDSGVISCYDKDDILKGTILANDGDWELMLDGHDPIKERWEDGCGNSLSLVGWGYAENDGLLKAIDNFVKRR